MFSKNQIVFESDLRLSELTPTNLAELSISEDGNSLKIELINYDTGHEKRMFVILDRKTENSKLLDAVIEMYETQKRLH